MNLKTRRAETDEIDTALQLLYEAAVWLKSQSIDYWQMWLEPAEHYVAWIAGGFKNREFYFVYDGADSLVGMYRLQFEDEMFWGKRDDRAAYVHSFTTRRSLKGWGVGTDILRMIEAEGAASGIEFLRLDCSSENFGLCKYYEAFGFVPSGDIELFGERLRLYEKPI